MVRIKKIYIKIDGMTCDHCKSKITKELENYDNINDVIFDGNIALVKYKGKLDQKKIIKSVVDLGYYTDVKMISDNKKDSKRLMSFSEILKFMIIIIVILFLFNKIFGLDIFNVIPVIDNNMSYLMLFLTGLFTSIHCISMCGAINLLATTSQTKNFKKPFLYNLGRLISYTVIGGIVGLIGSSLNVNVYIQSTIIMMASVLMFMMALKMIGVINFSFNFKLLEKIKFKKTNSSLVLGLINGLMPCGPLQAMQLYALSTASLTKGALSMFFFALGTIPLMLFMGLIVNFIKNKHKRIVNKISLTLILILSVIMFNRGLLYVGIDISKYFTPNYDNYIRSEIREDHQIIEFNLTYRGYKDIIVEKGTPVKMVIKVGSNSLTGCNNALYIKDLGISKDLKYGENIIEFTPTKTGKFTYTCWMGMIRNTIVVVDDISKVSNSRGD